MATIRTKIDLNKLKSKLEVSGLKSLLSIKRKYKFNVDYETEELSYFIPKKYVPDFIITFKDGRKMYIEMKGYLREEDKVKLVAVKRDHPDIDLRIVFQKDNKVYRNPNFKYTDWAKKYGIPSAIGTPPSDWFRQELVPVPITS